MIKAIDKSSVHRICAGQVISDLVGCVKELVENALDAQASAIEVRFTTTDAGGLDTLVVVDNGTGIHSSNYSALCLKHCTSKIEDFGDLASVTSFGFRGEALSSLCAVAGGLSVATKYEREQNDNDEDEESAVKLEYDCHGVLVSQEPTARERGTTITVKNLFATLPVRLREFKKHFKRELNKCIDLLQAFALVAVNVRITAVNLSIKSGRNILVSTCGSPTIKLNMSSVFGAKSLSSIMEVDISVSSSSSTSTPNGSTKPKQASSKKSDTDDDDDKPDADSQRSDVSELPTQESEESQNTPDGATIRVHGLISRPVQTHGRTSSDRQFFYINNRPCDLPKLAKVANEVYRTYNSHQYPMIVWNLIMEPDMYDVNVSPNKRTIFLHNERVIFENIKNELDRLFSPNRAFAVSKFPTRPSFPIFESPAAAAVGMNVDSDNASRDSRATPISGSSSSSNVDIVHDPAQSASICAESCCSGDASCHKRDATHVHPHAMDESLKRIRTHEEASPSSSLRVVSPSSNGDSAAPVVQFTESPRTLSSQPRPRVLELMAQSQQLQQQQQRSGGPSSPLSRPTPSTNAPPSPFPSSRQSSTSTARPPTSTPSSQPTRPTSTPSSQPTRQPSTPFRTPLLTQTIPTLNTQKLIESIHTHERTLNSDSIAHLYTSRAKRDQQQQSRVQQSKEAAARFESGIRRDKEQLAVEELNRYIRKTDFLEMRVLGQFNLGFIVVELRGDLFIVDQHASDEKYNYEDLMTSWKFTSQRLISPMPLELPAQLELLAIEHQDILKKNGFEVMVDETRHTGSRVFLVAIPQSTTTFGVGDLEDLLHKINDATTTSGLANVKCARVLAQLASKACRKSIMIGDALSMSAMEKIVTNLNGLEHPWNCPHGRPTMRHLFDMRRI
ncbi:Mismatch repair endonuclease pms2 [Podochytrium sp. JEL0797]|nr:Mismatch repair endonuclease pms2 [Podochytrium sp. JEL0797]